MFEIGVNNLMPSLCQSLEFSASETRTKLRRIYWQKFRLIVTNKKLSYYRGTVQMTLYI